MSDNPRHAPAESGGTAVATKSRRGRRLIDEDLISWARANGRAVEIDQRTKWGNPVVVTSTMDRDAGTKAYREHIASRPDLLADLPSLREKVLLCWCHPRRCQGDVLAELAEAAS